jgi:hypothetical protein
MWNGHAYVYVANASQHALYSKALDPAYMVIWWSGAKVCASSSDPQFPHGKRISFLDDDISDIDLGLSHSEYGVHSVCRCSCRVKRLTPSFGVYL